MADISNITANITSVAAGSAQGAPSFAAALFMHLWHLVSAPFLHSHMQWILIPLLLTFVLTEFYFARHPDEELGWNAALVNSLVLVFVAIDLAKTIFEEQTPVQVAKLFFTSIQNGEHLSSFLVIIFIGGLGLSLAIINYFHLLPRKVAYVISSHPPINFIAYVAIVTVYSEKAGHPIAINTAFVVAATLLFTALVAIIFAMQRAFGTKDLSLFRRN